MVFLPYEKIIEIMISSIKETCLYVSDLQATKDFYTQKLGLEVISYVADRHVFFRIGQDVLLCFNPEATRNEQNLPPHFAQGPQHIAFEVPASLYQATKADLLSKGISIIHTQPWGKDFESFYFLDADQNVLEIVPKGMWD